MEKKKPKTKQGRASPKRSRTRLCAPKTSPKSSRSIKITLPPWFGPYLEALASCGNMTLACLKIGIDRSTPRKWFKEHPDEEAQARIEQALIDGHESLVARYYQRALRGSEKALWNIIQTQVARFNRRVELSGTVERKDLSKLSNEELLDLEKRIKG